VTCTEENRWKAVERLQEAYAQAQLENVSNVLVRHIEITHDILTRTEPPNEKQVPS